MLELVFAMFVALIWQIVREAIRVGIRKTRAPMPEPLCGGCFYAHMQHGAKGQLAISCTYGGFVRPMKLDVLYCTDYRSRNSPVRNGVIGFVREIAPAE
jgi:hypothetical protein